MIASAMAYAIVAGTLILGATILGASLLRRHGRPERAVWIFALLAALAFPAWTLSRPRVVVADPSSALVAPATAVDAPPALPSQATPLSARMPWDTMLVALWLLASSVLTVRWLASAARLGWISRTWRRTTVDGVEVCLTDDFGPAVTGLARPRIVVPSWATSLPDEQLRLVLRHEVEHIRARDHWVAAVARTARIVAPWNPVVWLAGAGLVRAMELDCDRRVLRSYPDVASYGATLLTVSAKGGGVMAATAFADSEIPLRERIMAMTTPRRAFRLTATIAAVCMGSALVVGATLVPAPAVRVQLRTAGPATTVATTQDVGSMPAPRVIGPPMTPTLDPRTWTRSVRDSLAWWTSPDGQWLVYEGPGPAFVFLSYTPRQIEQAPTIVNPREVLSGIATMYPRRLQDQGLGGTVAVQFQLDEAGRVIQRRIGQISMYPELDRAALSVAQLYRFTPAIAEDGPVSVWVVHPITFRAP